MLHGIDTLFWNRDNPVSPDAGNGWFRVWTCQCFLYLCKVKRWFFEEVKSRVETAQKWRFLFQICTINHEVADSQYRLHKRRWSNKLKTTPNMNGCWLSVGTRFFYARTRTTTCKIGWFWSSTVLMSRTCPIRILQRDISPSPPLWHSKSTRLRFV